MWINTVLRPSCLGLLGVLLASSPAAIAESGQYRSKVLLSPTGEMAKGAGLSIEELEQQIDAIDQPYAKSSAGRHLARHYVERGEYAKAIEYYETALAAQGLADIANREMLRELAQVHLLSKNYWAAANTLERVLAIDLVATVADFLLLARAQYKLDQYVPMVATLDSIKEKNLTLSTEQLHQALALYYGVGAYAQSEDILKQLLIQEPDNPKNWHLLVSVYLQGGKQREALDSLVLARRKFVPFSERDILLLANLQAATKNPLGAAQTLSRALAEREIESNGEHYRKLFEFWLQAREKSRAQLALAQAAQLTGDTELYLYLAQLQMDQKAWPEMNRTVLTACESQIDDRFVSRANLLLGISQLKLGDERAARRSFINASLIGGASEQAAQWLAFMKAEPATREEARIIVGACYGEEDKHRKTLASIAPAAGEIEVKKTQTPAEEFPDFEAALVRKTVPAMRLFYTVTRQGIDGALANLESSVKRLNIALLKARGEAKGPLHFIFSTAGDGFDSIKIALPVKGLPVAKGKFKSGRASSFNCASHLYMGKLNELPDVLKKLATMLESRGERLSGEVRIIVRGSKDSGIEIQLGLL